MNTNSAIQNLMNISSRPDLSLGLTDQSRTIQIAETTSFNDQLLFDGSNSFSLPLLSPPLPNTMKSTNISYHHT